MDIDPSHYFEPSSPDQAASPPPGFSSLPLSHVTLPTLPRPSLSPSTTRVSFVQQEKSGKMSPGLDLSASYARNAAAGGAGPGGGDSLEDDVARARAERAARRGQMNLGSDDSAPTSPANSSADDPRDSASARENIMHLVSAGQSQVAGKSAPSLAMFMGGGQNRRVHKVNQGMTEQEQEETERLEKEMAATRARWGNKGTEEPDAAPRGGMSLANLMRGQAGGGPATMGDDEPKRWQPSTPANEPTRAHTAPLPSSTTTTKPAAAGPMSLAAAFGSTATGPRLNSQSQAQEEDGPAHARSGGGGFAMPGLARQAETPKTEEPETVEPKVISRQAPPASPTKVPFPTSDSPTKTSSTNNPTLTRLRGSSIVAERLKFAEQLQQQSQAPVSSPTKERGSVPVSPEKRRSVLDRWNRDQPGLASPTKSSSAPLPLKSPGLSSPWSIGGKPVSASPKAEEELVDRAESTPAPAYSKPSWDHAPIAAKSVSQANRSIDDEEPAERKHTRGVALPGMGSSSGGSSAAFPPTSPTTRRTEPPASPGGGSGGVRAAAMRWGRTDSDAQREKLEELKRLKESYGVKVDVGAKRVEQPAEMKPAPPRETGGETGTPTSKPPAAVSSAVPRPQTTQRTTPVSQPSANPLVDRIISLVLTPSPSPRLGGEILSLDVFHLNSPTDNPHPIEHNHLFHLPEILGIVARTARGQSSDDIETNVWVWRGSEAKETAKTQERIAKLEKKTGVRPVEVMYRREPRALVEAFEGQLTICRGPRDEFDHLATRLFIVQSHEQVVFVEETDLTAKSLCSGYCAVFSLPGEVYAWLGEGSTALERESCCQFAESISDGRNVHVLAEGEETAWFWHSLDETEGVEYASAHHWRRRHDPPVPNSLIRSDSSEAERVEAISDPGVYLVDGGSLEIYVLVSETARTNKSDLETAFEAARVLSSRWEERGFESKTPAHVLVLPSLIPRDLPHLARALDLSALNHGTTPRKMNVYTLEEAKQELL
ncbi:hypothetical protein JCM10212_001829 [Sporobolomyces blumeae]